MDDVELRLNAEFQKGKIEDLHFHMLEDAIASRRRDFRKAEVSGKFEGLPKWITKEMEGMLKDGKISRTEYEGFVSIISKTEALTPQQKEELAGMVEEWEDEDKEPAEEDIDTDEDIEIDDFEKEEIEEEDTDDEMDFDEEDTEESE